MTTAQVTTENSASTVPPKQTEESRTTGTHRTTSVMIVAHVQSSASPSTTGIMRSDASNGTPDSQIANLGVETDLVAPKGASFRNDRDLQLTVHPKMLSTD